MNLPGVGDPLELSRRMEARGLIRRPTAATAALQEKIADTRNVRSSPSYQAARVRDPGAELSERELKRKKRAMRRKPLRI